MRRMNGSRLAGAILVALAAVVLIALAGLAECRCIGSDCYEDVIVSRAGDSSYDGTYTLYQYTSHAQFEQVGGACHVWKDCGVGWAIADGVVPDEPYYGSFDNYTETYPPTTGWEARRGIASPPPASPPPTVSGGYPCTCGPSITASLISGDTTESGGTATFTLTPDPAPTADVTVPLSSSDTSEGTVPASVVLPSGSTDPVTVTVTGVDDAVKDGDIDYTIVTGDPTSADADFNDLGARDVDDVSVTNLDNEVPGVTVTPTGGLTTTEAGGTATFDVKANTAPTADVTVPLSSSDTTEGTVPASVVLPAGSTDPVTVTVTGVNDDVNDGDVGYTIVTGDPTSGDGDYGALGAADVADVSVTNLNDDWPWITVKPTSGLVTTEDGGTATFTVVLDTQPNLSACASPGTSRAWGGVTIDLSSSNPAEGTVDPGTLVFTEANWDQPQTVTVTGVDDAVLDGDIIYVIVTAAAVGGDYNGFNAADVIVTNLDDEVAIVIVPTGAGGPEEFLDVVLPLGDEETPPLAGDEPLVASYVVGDLITGSCQFLGPSGNPTADGYIHLYLYSVDITATPEALELIAHWTADFNWMTFEFEFAYDTSELTPGYYDLRLSFPDGTSETFRIEVTPAV